MHLLFLACAMIDVVKLGVSGLCNNCSLKNTQWGILTLGCHCRSLGHLACFVTSSRRQPLHVFVCTHAWYCKKKIHWNIRQQLCVQGQMKSMNTLARVCALQRMQTWPCSGQCTFRWFQFIEGYFSLCLLWCAVIPGLCEIFCSPESKSRFSWCEVFPGHCFQSVTALGADSQDKPYVRNPVAVPMEYCLHVELAERAFTLMVSLFSYDTRAEGVSMVTPWPRPHPGPIFA